VQRGNDKRRHRIDWKEDVREIKVEEEEEEREEEDLPFVI